MSQYVSSAQGANCCCRNRTRVLRRGQRVPGRNAGFGVDEGVAYRTGKGRGVADGRSAGLTCQKSVVGTGGRGGGIMDPGGKDQS